MFRSRHGNAKVVIIVVVVVLGVMFLMCSGLMVALLLPAVQQARVAARRMQSSNNLKMIGLALHNYHDTYNSLPAAYVPDADGKPMHSWRVAILPFIEERPMFDQYDFDQPWDSPHNLQVTKRMPLAYASPALSSEQVDEGLTSYVALAGPHTALSTKGWHGFRDITRGTSNTIAVVEDSEHPVPWSKPDDLTPEEFLSLNFSDNYFHVVQALMCDGSVHALPEGSKQEVAPLVSIDGK